MTSRRKLRSLHFAFVLGVIPTVFAVAAFFWAQGQDGAILAIAAVAGALAGATDFAARGSGWSVAVALSAFVSATALTYGFLVGFVVIACATGNCPFN